MAGFARNVRKRGPNPSTGMAFDDRPPSSLMNRYILNMNVMDFAGQFWITAFNETAEQMMGISANDLQDMKVRCVLNDSHKLSPRIPAKQSSKRLSKRRPVRLSRSR